MLTNEPLPIIEGVEFQVEYPEYGSYPKTTHFFKRREGTAFYKDARYYVGWIDINQLPSHYLEYLKTVVLRSMEADHIPIIFTFHVDDAIKKHLHKGI